MLVNPGQCIFLAQSIHKRVVGELWFAVNPRDHDIVQIREAWIDPYLTGDMWLVRGRDRDLLMDCGTGIVSPRPVVEAIARNPILAIACNRWYDHAGGLHEFAERGCRREDAKLIAAPTPDSSVASIYVSDEMLSTLPFEGYTTEHYRTDVTPGSIALWESATGSLFTSDTLFDDPTPERRTQRIVNLTRLGKLPVKTVYAGHFGSIGRNRMLDLISAELQEPPVSVAKNCVMQSNSGASRSRVTDRSAIPHSS